MVVLEFIKSQVPGSCRISLSIGHFVIELSPVYTHHSCLITAVMGCTVADRDAQLSVSLVLRINLLAPKLTPNRSLSWEDIVANREHLHRLASEVINLVLLLKKTVFVDGC